mmetsp:Transcript_21553/g.32074  ORF Transcript_21553/g.32074 Transcript_21553/m.32074 type:complete len:440 (+) Transcript_21553:115-1434(+)
MLALGLLLFSAAPAKASFARITDYEPNTDVVPHSKIDLDQQNVDSFASAYNFTAAYRWYSEGGNSIKSDMSIRTLQGFSTGAGAKMQSNEFFILYAGWWGNYFGQNSAVNDYADRFITDGCMATGQFDGAPDAARAELCKKGSSYQALWMYVIWEMTDAVNDCQLGDLANNGGAAHAWDEAVAFYSGSLEGTDGSGTGAAIHALAEKRCRNFGTCDEDGNARSNDDAIQLFKEGQDALLAGKCQDTKLIRNKIVAKMTVPLIQGTIRYAYRSDPNGPIKGGDKDRAEGWAFAAAVLPQINNCDKDVAAEVIENMIWNASTPVTDGGSYVKEQLEKVYECLGITCSEVGGLRNNADTGYISGYEPCSDASSSNSDDDDNAMSDGAIAGTVVAVVVVFALVGAVMFYCGKRSMYRDLEKRNGNGIADSTTEFKGGAGAAKV